MRGPVNTEDTNDQVHLYQTVLFFQSQKYYED